MKSPLTFFIYNLGTCLKITNDRSRRGDEAEVLGRMHARIRLLTSSATIFKQSLTQIALCLSIYLLAGCATTPTEHKATAAALPKHAPVIFMAGDSTMSLKPLFPAQPERGWGQLLPLYFKDEVRIKNFAKNGRSSKSFRDEGLWQKIMGEIQPGDYVIVQFGHNDSKKDDRDRSTEPFGSFKENMERFVREVRDRQGKPILATPIIRRSFLANGVLRQTHGDYPVAIRQVATEQKVPLLELEKRSETLVNQLGPELSMKLFMHYEPGEFASLPEGKKDNTHLNAFGASRICDLATDEMRTAVPELAEWLVPGK